MTPTEAPGGDYSRSPVPISAKVSGWRIALIKLGIVIALPGFIMGAQIGAALGVASGALSILIGGMLLTAAAALTGTVGAKSGLSTSLITQFAFGRWGGRIVSAVLAVALIGWFGVTAQIFANSVQGIIKDLNVVVWPSQVYVILGGTLMVATTIFGFSALRRLADVAIPLLLIVLLLATYRSFRIHSLAALLAVHGQQSRLELGISEVVGGFSASICIFPDLARFARTPSDARLAAGLTFGAGAPVVIILASVMGIATRHNDLASILTALGLGVPALIVLVFKAWATNSGNLYSASLGLAPIFPNVRPPLVVSAIGAAGILLAALGFAGHLVPFLVILSIAIPPIAGIYVADFFFVRGQLYDVGCVDFEPALSWSALTAWPIGICVASATSQKFLTLTTIPAADGVLTSFGLYLLLAKYLFPRVPPTLAIALGSDQSSVENVRITSSETRR